MFRSRQAAIAAVVLSVGAASSHAAVLFNDSFESYTAGGAPLDKNQTGANAAANGTGNPWFGPGGVNAHVVGTDSAVTGSAVAPIDGTKMIIGSNVASDQDSVYYNIAYRNGGGAAIRSNLTMKFSFYDPIGSGATAATYEDYAALSNYTNVPTNTDYTSTSLTGAAQRLSLGATNNEAAGFDATKYQARVVGDTTGYASGWHNLPIARTVGWHTGQIVLGDLNANGTTTVSFYIDNLTTPLLTLNSSTTTGVNAMELNTDFGAKGGYYDAVSLASTPEPGSAGLLLVGAVAGRLRRARRRRA